MIPTTLKLQKTKLLAISLIFICSMFNSAHAERRGKEQDPNPDAKIGETTSSNTASSSTGFLCTYLNICWL